MMDTFTREGHTLNENGDPCLITTNTYLVDLFFQLVRGLTPQEMDAIIMNCVKEAKDMKDHVDLFVLAMHSRATRGIGKGEKQLFVDMLQILHKYYDIDSVCAMIKLVPHYGCYKDLLLLIDPCKPVKIANKAKQILVEQLRVDGKELEDSTLDNRNPNLTLVGKWAPREGTKYSKTAQELAIMMYGASNKPSSYRKYRKLLSNLNRALNTTEVLMTSDQWGQIKFKQVPSICLQRNRKAFLNEKPKTTLTYEEEESGNRYPDRPDRVESRKNLRELLMSKKGLHGAELMPHTLVKACMNSTPSKLELDLIDAQWSALRSATLDSIRKVKELRAQEAQLDPNQSPTQSKSIDLGNLVPLVDVSASMEGLPMTVAIALGIMISEMTQPAFRDRILTFETSPKWVNLSGDISLFDKVKTLQNSPWGGSTNFEAAINQILEVVVLNRLSQDQIPDLIVFSDMQFDHANMYRQPWHTSYERLENAFASAGMKIHGVPYKPPHIIFWNLRASIGFPAAADMPRVQLLSGFSPSLLKLLLNGEPIEDGVEEIYVDGTLQIVKKTGPTPQQTFRMAIDSPDFDQVRTALSQLNVGFFKEYTFEKP